MRRLLILVCVTTALALGVTGAAAAPPAATVIAGADLPHSIRFAAVDADALTRRINDPPRFDEPAIGSGLFYRLSSPYWADALSAARADTGTPTTKAQAEATATAVAAAPADAEALYFPSTGLVRATRGEDAFWIALDRRQQAIIGRYLRLGRAGLLSAAPGILEVLAAAAPNEAISVTVGDHALSAGELSALWQATAGLEPTRLDPPEPPSVASDSGLWLIASLPEGRTVQLLYDAGARTLTDQLGVERYPVNDQLAALLAALDGSPLTLTPNGGDGGPAWWLLMLGGGAVAVGVAVWLQRRLAPRPA